jgi:hypothetical protein
MWVKALPMLSLKLYLMDPKGTDGDGGTRTAFRADVQCRYADFNGAVVGDRVEGKEMGVL